MLEGALRRAPFPVLVKDEGMLWKKNGYCVNVPFPG